jgi:hypothetical protein
MSRQAQLTGEVRGAFFGSITRRMPNPPHRPRPWKPITGVSDQPLSQSNPPQRKRYQLPGAYSANRSFGYFPPPPADHDTVLYIGRDPGDLRSYFADVRTVGDVGEDVHAYLLAGQRRSWDEIWPWVRSLTVS